MNTYWGTKDYSSGKIFYSVSVAAVNKNTYGGKFVNSSGTTGGLYNFRYYNYNSLNNDTILTTKLIVWMNINAIVASSGTATMYIFGRMQDLLSGDSVVRKGYWLALGRTNGTTALRLGRGTVGSPGGTTILGTNTSYINSTWYKVQMQITTSGSNANILVLDDTNEDNNWTTVFSITDSSGSQITTAGYFGFGSSQNNSGNSGTFFIDDFEFYDSI